MPIPPRHRDAVLCSRQCKHRKAKATRRAREHGATGSYSFDDVMRAFVAAGKVCSYCREPLPDGELPEPDHVIPLSRGGHNGMSNIVPACRRCNGDKRDLLLADWLRDRSRRGLPPVSLPPLHTPLGVTS